MKIFDLNCYATYAGIGELIVLLKEFESWWNVINNFKCVNF